MITKDNCSYLKSDTIRSFDYELKKTDLDYDTDLRKVQSYLDTYYCSTHDIVPMTKRHFSPIFSLHHQELTKTNPRKFLLDYRVLIFLTPKHPDDLSLCRQFIEKFKFSGLPVKIFFIDVNTGGLGNKRVHRTELNNLINNESLSSLGQIDKNTAEYMNIASFDDLDSEKDIIQ